MEDITNEKAPNDIGHEFIKLVPLYIYIILWKYSNENQGLKQTEIKKYLLSEFNIQVERKAIRRNLELLRDAGFDVEIEDRARGNYLSRHLFEDSELRYLIDGVLCSKCISAKYAQDLAERLCQLTDKSFQSHGRHTHSADEWNRTEQKTLFLNIEIIDEAIENRLKIRYQFNKYGTDKKPHKSSEWILSPYQLLIRNQHYYLMGHTERFNKIVYQRLDKISDITLTKEKALPLTTLPGYKNGINYKKLSSSMPYMYNDEPKPIDFLADVSVIDQIFDWFGKDIRILKTDDEKKVKIHLTASEKAMEIWAMQYLNYVEILSPASLRDKIKDNLAKATGKYGKA